MDFARLSSQLDRVGKRGRHRCHVARFARFLGGGARPRACEVRLRRVDARTNNARLEDVEVVLRKLGKGSRAVAGRLVRAPRKGSVVVIEFPDGMH